MQGLNPSELLLESAYQIGYYCYLEDPNKALAPMFATEAESEEAKRGYDDARIVDVRA